MALTFPVSLAGFVDDLCWMSTSFHLDEAVAADTTTGGEIVVVDHGTRLWSGTVTLASRTGLDAEEMLARVRVLQDARASFLMTPQHYKRPRAQNTFPTGASILAISGRSLSLTGVGAGYVLSAGDFLSFQYGTNPTRYALHQLVEGVTANGSGVTGLFEVTPILQPGAVADIAILVNKPVLKARMVPGSLAPIAHPRRGYGQALTFSWRQTLR